MTHQEKLDLLIAKLEGLSRREYVTRQHLLLMIHDLKSKMDDDCPHQRGQ